MAGVSFCLYILLLCIYTESQFLNIPKQNSKDKKEALENSVNSKDVVDNTDGKKKEEVPAVNINMEKADNEKSKNVPPSKHVENKNVPSSNNVTPPKILADNPNIKTSAELESGAVMRGIYVFVGLTLVFIIYIAFKTYRRGNKKNVLIKKYGVRTRKSDIEMEPLPLDEDDDDETVFDLGNINNR